VIVEDVPAMLCARCGEAIFEMATIEKIRRMVHGEAKPVKSIVTAVFEFA
jgi:HTH-type transcriptional regulator/antitoxin MqsA